MKQKKELTKKELALSEFKSRVLNTIFGKMSVSDLMKKYDAPNGVLKMSKVEVKHKSTAICTIIVDRFVDGELHFGDNIVVRNVKKNMVLELCNGIKTEFVRHPTYNGLKMPNATQAEMKAHALK